MDLLEEVARLLDVAVARGTNVGPDALLRKTRPQLLDAAKKLGLQRVSKLPKEQLARRVLQALQALPEWPREPAPGGQTPAPKSAGSAAARALASTDRPAGSQSRRRRAVPEGKGGAHPGAAGTASTAARPEGSAAPRSSEPAAAPEPGREEERDPTPLMKLDLGPAPRIEPPVEHVPWSYGLDRITAAAVDPDRLVAYWEVTDPAIERARVGLGPGGAGAWLNLRVYDTSGIIFDGTNAHSYFDHGIDRSTRQWFFDIRKPSSTAFVEIGMKSSEGYFAKIARSGRVDFPRSEPAPWTEPEWMTVVASTGEARSAGKGAPAHPAAPPAGGRGEPSAQFTPIPLWVMREIGDGHEFHLRELREGGWERVEWFEARGEGWYELEGRVEWEGPTVVTTWQAGPFSHPVQVEPPHSEEWKGRSFAYKVGDVTHVVYGPWQVVIHNLGARSGRAVVSQWEVYRSWVTHVGREVRPPGSRPTAPGGGSERIALGASERVWVAASELRLGGASELWRIGASELRLRGASERLYAGASEWMLRGASERRLGGASEQRLGGASEQRLGGASEQRLGGASEQRLGGASEQRPGGGAGRLEDDRAPMPYPRLEGAQPDSGE